MKRILNTMGSFLAWVIFGFALFLFANNAYQVSKGAVIPMNFGWGAATVVSGSMEPGIPVGAMVLIQEQSEYLPGEVIAYANSDGQSVTHRIVSIANGSVVTRGDSNNIADPAFPEEQILGEVKFVLPSVGAVLMFMKQPVVLGSLALLSFLVFILPSPHRKKNSNKASQESEQAGTADAGPEALEGSQ